VVKVLKGDFEEAKSQKARLEEELGVDVGFEVSAPIVDSSCPSRHKCFGPLRLGARMNYPNVYDSSQHYTQWNCAIGFMLTDEKILTAGHCTHQRQAPWKGHQNYQDAYDRIGERTSSRYNSTDKRDLSLISLEDWSANKTKRLYGDDEWPTVLTMEDGPSELMRVCVSLNRQDKYWCGIVKDTSVKWESDTADPPIMVWGAGMDFYKSNRTALPGDSGGPIVYESQECGHCTPLRTPIGIVNAGNEVDGTATSDRDLYFAKVQWALNNQDGWPGKSIYSGAEGSG
jgi:hypothetical protein